MAYDVFVRNWWKRGKMGREPDPKAHKTYIQRGVKTEEEARSICQRYNATHEPGWQSRKAEYTSS